MEISGFIVLLIVLTIWGCWAIASGAVLYRLGFFSAGPLLRAPQRVSQFTLLEPAAVAFLYFGMMVAAVILAPRAWLLGPAPVVATTSAPATSTASMPAGTTSAPATQAGAASLPASTAPGGGASSVEVDPEGLARREMLDIPIRLILAGMMIFLARRLVVGGLPEFGLSGRHILPGMGAGIGTLLLLIPWLAVVSVLTELARSLFTHAPVIAHPILEALQKNPKPWAVAVLLVAEAVVAPLAEELLFRGLLQTALLRLGRRSAAPQGFEPILPGIPAHTLSPPLPPPAVSAAWRWFTIIIVSALFALIHFNGDNPEVLPPLFLLAVALGYLYERTGNLFACMVLHCVFNTTMTLLSQWAGK